MPKILSIIAILLVLAGCGGIEATRSQPNILLVVIDTLRADHVGCYGYERNTTPNLDAFARDCIVYTNCYATCSWTKPSVTSLLTGLNCREHGVLAAWDALPEGMRWLPEEFQRRGYITAAFSNNLFICRQDGFARGFDYWWQWAPGESWRGRIGNEIETDDAVLVNQVIRWQRNAQAPWFAYLHLMGPHGPYHLPARANDFGPEPLDQYDAKMRYVDHQVGRLLADVHPDTLIIITADHGEEFGEHGGTQHGRTLHDEVLRVPLLIYWPHCEPRIEQGLVGLDRVVSAILDDVLPETGGKVRCHLEIRDLGGTLKDVLTRTVTSEDLPETDIPAVDAEELRREQLEALGYF